MLALIKLTLTLPGLSAPKVSCVTFPMAPTGRRIGLARHATGDERQQEGQRHRDNTLPDRHAEARVPEPGKRNKRHDLADGKPAHWRLDGSMRPVRSQAAERKESICPRSRNALNAVRQLSAKLNSPAATMQDAPNQSVHCTMAAKPALVMTPLVWRTGTTTAQHNVPETEHGRADPHAGDGAGGEKYEIPGKDHGAARPGFVVTAEQPLLQVRQQGPRSKSVRGSR
jgi:hypothetical protein